MPDIRNPNRFRDLKTISPYWRDPVKTWDETFEAINNDPALLAILAEDDKQRDELWDRAFNNPPVKWHSYLGGCFMYLRFFTFMKDKFPNWKLWKSLHLAAIKVTENSREYIARKNQFINSLP